MPREQYESPWKDYYHVLGVKSNASIGTIRRVWQQLSQIYRPDGSGDTELNSARMQELHEAYEVLSDSPRRVKYDQACQSRTAQGSTPSGVTASHQASPPPRAQPPTASQPPSEHSAPPRVEPRRSLERRAKLIAVAGAIGMAVLFGVGVLPGLLPGGRGPKAPQPISFHTSNPTPVPTLVLTPNLTHTASLPPTSEPATGSVQFTPAPAPTSFLFPLEQIPVTSPEAEALGFRGFQVVGSPWMVHFTSECKEAPCLRSAALTGAGYSTLSLGYRDELPASVRTISFDVRTTGAGCCASFRVVGAPRQVSVDLAGDGSWTHVEVAVPDIRPLSFQWQFWNDPAGATPADGIWVDKIQFN